MGQRLNEITIEGFKSIERLQFELRPINLLIGPNGAGKSNFIAAFGLLNDLVEGRLQVHTARRGGAAGLLHFGPKVTRQIAVRLTFGPNTYEVRLARAAGDELFFESEECSFQGKDFDRPYCLPLGAGHKESNLKREASADPRRIASYVLSSVRSWKIYHFHDTSDSARLKQKQPIDDNAILRPDASNLAAYLRRLQQTDESAYRRIVMSVRLVAPFFDDFALRPDPIRSDLIQLEWRERGSDEYFNAHTLSDGTLRFICLCALLLQPQLPTSILIDEPELGLHPYAINQLAAMVRSASTRSQVIIATQSVTLMNQFEPDDVVVVDRKGPASEFRRVTAAEVAAWKDAYALGEIWEKNIIGGRPG